MRAMFSFPIGSWQLPTETGLLCQAKDTDTATAKTFILTLKKQVVHSLTLTASISSTAFFSAVASMGLLITETIPTLR